MYYRILIATLVLFSSAAFSQVRTVVGRVVESGTEKPIRDVNIISGGDVSSSNHLGYFELTVDHSKPTTLTISHITYKVISLPLPAEDRFKLYLEKDTLALRAINLNHYPAERPTILPEQNNSNTNETEAKFPGGIESFYNFMGNSLSASLPQVTGKGFRIIFTIDENGKATDWSVSDSPENIQAAVREAFEKMPAWIAATQRQKNVKQSFSVSVNRIVPFEFKSGDITKLASFIKNTIRYPAQARRMGIEGDVYVQFNIDEFGNIGKALVLKGVNADCDREVIRVISSAPAECLKVLFDKTQQYEFVLPVFYSLEGSQKTIQNSVPLTDALMLPEVTVMAGGLTIQRRELGGGAATTVRSFSPPPEPVLYTDLYKALEQPKAVTRLSLRTKNLTSFPPEIISFKNLEFLDLEQNQIQQLPAEVGALSDLKELYMLENNLVTLPDNFNNLKKLRILGLAGNQLNSFPQPIIALEKLEILDLSHNQLTQIPANIRLMKNLKVLVLVNNQVKNIPAEFYQLKNLEKIYLQENPIDTNDISLLKKAFPKAEIGF